MKPSQLLRFLSIAIANRLNVLVTSAPGIGKSALLMQAAAVAGARLIISHPPVEEPTDVKGLPMASPGDLFASFLPFGQLQEILTATSLTVWLLEDFGQAHEAVQKAYMQLLHARELCGKKIPDCVVILAATNRRQDRAGVSGVLEPVKSRFATILELEADLSEWCAWAIRAGLPAEIIAFLRWKSDLLSAFVPTADLTNSPSPRTWHHAAKLFSLDLPKEILPEVLSGAVGQDAATQFLAFIDMYRQLPSVDAILIDPDSAPIPANVSALYAVSTALASRASEQNAGRVFRYAERLNEAEKGDFGAMVVRDSIRRCPAVQLTPDFVRLVAGPLGSLIHGN